ncbi:uncharacterized protein LOC143192686 isoform X2 [Rhynchophorus ferrugineus]|uniref:uncharacterized protein LOC143192686 isoform X2 n=1 Tax=Rhynchophorus ferrugineus TaxID=354439 RepID=UPI003FCC3AA3
MQNAGQYGPGGAAGAHQSQQFAPSEPSPNGGSTTSSLRQFRKKDVDKSNLDQSQKQAPDGQVGRMPPHNSYPPVSNDCYRYPTHQFSDYSSQVKYSNPPETSQANHITTSVIQKPKPKDYMEMCNMQQAHLMKPTYPSHLPNHQQYLHDNSQYIHKDTNQIHPPGFKPESHFFPKEQHQYQQLLHPMQPKFNPMMTQGLRKYNTPTPSDNPFLNKLSKIDPSMARSIISDHHVQDTQSNYPTMDQRPVYPQQNRYYPGPMYQQNQYPPNPPYSMNTSHYPNYPSATCSYPRTNQMPPMPGRFHPMERSMSPSSRRSYPENMHMPHMSCNIPQKITPPHNYQAQYGGPEYSQHYQHRRMPQEMYSQPCRPPQYVQGHHQIPGQDIQEMSENTVSPSDSLKKFIENWAEEEPNNEMSGVENSAARENLKIRDDPPSGTVYMINANDVQYFENSGIPLVTSDNGGIQLTPENYQYLLKNGLIDNSGVVRIMEPSSNNERVVNLQIMDTPKNDCLVTNKSRPKECEISPVGKKPDGESKKVVIHQNTVVNTARDVLPIQQNMEQVSLHEAVIESINASKELVDKNCSPINLDQLDPNREYNDVDDTEKEVERSDGPETAETNNSFDGSKMVESPDESKGLKSMPIIDLFSDSSMIATKVTQHDKDQPVFNAEKDEPQDPDEVMDDKETIDQNIDKSKPVEERLSESPIIKIEDNQSPEDSMSFDDFLDNNSKIISGNESTPQQSLPPNEENVISNDGNLNPDDPSKSNETLIEVDVDNKDSIIQPITMEPSTPNTTVAPVGKRKRIFSVDDIIHNIGNNTRRQADMDTCTPDVLNAFLMRETEHSSLEQLLVLEAKYRCIKEEVIEIPDDNHEKPDVEIIEDPKTDENNDSSSKESTGDKEIIEIDQEVEEAVKSPCNLGPEEKTGNDVHYRRAITVDDSSVLLQISGELIEINISVVNGKKVITVVPISDSTVVDYNDNYELPSNDDNASETLEGGEKPDDITSEVSKIDEGVADVPDISQDEVAPVDTAQVIENVADLGEIKGDEIENPLNEVDNAQTEAPPCEVESNTEVLEYTIGEDVLLPAELFHEIVVSDPPEFCDDKTENIDLQVEPVSTSEILIPQETIIKKCEPEEETEKLPLPENRITHQKDDASISKGPEIEEKPERNRRNIKAEVLILSPTSTNIDDNFSTVKENVYLKPNVPSNDGDSPENASVITTKAAKKSYEMDLQIPAVTTSGDISAMVKTGGGESQDRVSSSKKEKITKETEKSNKPNKKSKKKAEKSEKLTEKSVKLIENSEKLIKRKESPVTISNGVKDMINNNLNSKPTKPSVKNNEITETDDEYVDFKELLKARKLRKQKKLQELKEKDSQKEIPQKPSHNGSVLKNDVTSTESKDTTSKQTPTMQINNLEDTLKSPKNKKPDAIKTSHGDQPQSNNEISRCKDSIVVPKSVSFPEDTPTSTSPGINSARSVVDRKNQTDNKKTPRNTQGTAVVVPPSVSEFMEEGVLAAKKKISFMDYVKRKRKESGDRVDDTNPEKKPKIDTDSDQHQDLKTTSIKSSGGIKTSFIIHSSDWEDTGSPKPDLKQSSEESLIQEFSGLIKSNAKPVIDVKEFGSLDNSTDVKLKEYKERVDSKLSSLNIQIPKAKSQVPERTCDVLYKSPETSNLMQRFLNNEKITSKEVERIKRIISYKRYIQRQGKSPSGSSEFHPTDVTGSTATRKLSPKHPSSSYEIQNRGDVDTEKQEVKLHIRKVNAKRKLENESDIGDRDPFSHSEANETSENKMDYSVYNRLGKDGLPKMIFKRNRQSIVSDDNDTNQPIVRLERIDLNTVKEKYNITVTNM